jgi:glycosyltransferase involved in cell wall biosynthesis
MPPPMAQHGEPRRLRVVICWMYISGYMAACWRAMAQRPEVDLFVVAMNPEGDPSQGAFNAKIMQGVNHRLMTEPQIDEYHEFSSLVAAHKPDVIVLCGWGIPAYLRIASDPRFAGVKFAMGMDTPYNGSVRQRLGKYAKRKFFQRLSRVFVTGERSWRLARVLGFSEKQIRRGVYGIDYQHFAPLHTQRASLPNGWPKRFLYMGRYIDDKAIDRLLEGYAQYRAMVRDPWPLTCCGHGPWGDAIRKAEGVEDRGFVQPADQPPIVINSGVFVLASRFDPWPLVVVESCASGLPVVCTEACGSAVELIRPYFNGLTCATEDAAALARAMRWMHEHHDRLPDMGRRCTEVAAGYSSDMWCERWIETFRDMAAE